MVVGEPLLMSLVLTCIYMIPTGIRGMVWTSVYHIYEKVLLQWYLICFAANLEEFCRQSQPWSHSQ